MADWYALVIDGKVALKVRVEDGFLETVTSSEHILITGREDSVDSGYTYSNGIFTPPVNP